MIELNTPTEPREVNTVEVFSIDGVTYSIPDTVPANVGLKYSKMLRTDGPEVAGGWILEELLTEEGYDALMNFDDLTDEQLESVILACQKVVTGSDPKGSAG